MYDNDSRLTAVSKLGRKGMGWLFNTSTFTGNLVIALLASYFFRKLGYTDDVNYVFLIGILAIGLWITEAIPPFAVGILIIALLMFGFGTPYLFSETSPVEIYLDTWTSNVIWLLLGGFFLAEGMKVAQIDRSLFVFTLNRFGRSPRYLLFGLMMTTAFGSMVMSNTATTAMMISSVLPMVNLIGKENPFAKSILIGIPAAAAVGGIGTIIGSTPNAIAVGALQEIGINITFLDWMIFGLPIALILVYSFYKILAQSIPKTMNIEDLKLAHLSRSSSADKKDKRAVIFTLIVTISLWLTEPIHGIPVAATSAVPIVFLTLTQVIKAEQVRALPWDTLMLVAGGLALGLAIVEVGLSTLIMEALSNLAFHQVWIMIIFSFIGISLSNIMSNTAASAILVPLGLSLTGVFGIATPLIIAISCSCALLLPVSTPANAIAYSTGMIEQKDFRKGGLFFIVVGPIVAFGIVMLWSWIFT
ncbi:MAG: DASS family sodium-coupled anion symporter [Brumimicrobium sp.]